MWRHPEAEHEAGGLRIWGGGGAVLLHAAEGIDADTIALLLERCRPGTALVARPEPEQDVVWPGSCAGCGGSHRPVTRSAPSSRCAIGGPAGFEEKLTAGRGRLDPRLAREGLALFRELPAGARRQVAPSSAPDRARWRRHPCD
jgi:streptomycin 6-kinase